MKDLFDKVHYGIRGTDECKLYGRTWHGTPPIGVELTFRVNYSAPLAKKNNVLSQGNRWARVSPVLKGFHND
jgi:hypothetical protein